MENAKHVEKQQQQQLLEDGHPAAAVANYVDVNSHSYEHLGGMAPSISVPEPYLHRVLNSRGGSRGERRGQSR